MRKVLSASSFNSTIETKKWLQCIWLGGRTVWIAAFAWHVNATYKKNAVNKEHNVKKLDLFEIVPLSV